MSSPSRVPTAVSILTPIVILLFTFAVFFPTLAAGFVDLDDSALLLDNTKWRGLGWEQVRWMFTTTLLGHYQPLTWVSYAINYEMAAMDAAVYHFTNVLIHSINAVLVYLVGMRLVRAALPGIERFPEHRVRLAAGLGALAWAVHPLRVESVAWVTERRDVLSTMFLLAALLAYLRMAKQKGGGAGKGSIEVGGTDFDGTRWLSAYVWSIGLLLLSLLSKPWGMSFFVVALVLDWYPLKRLPMSPAKWFARPYRGVLLEKLPFVALGILFAISAGTAANSAAMAMRTMEEWPLASRIAQAAYGLCFYVRKSIVPSDLAVLYELRHGLNPFAAEYMVCYGLIALFIVAAIVQVRRVPAIAAAGIVYAVFLAPVLGFFQSGDQFVADRYSYPATIGWALVVGAGFALAIRWAEKTRRMHAGLIMVVAVALLLTAGVLTLNQSMVWQNSFTLWEHAVKSGSATPYTRVAYGLNLERKSIVDERLTEAEQKELLLQAIEQFQIAAKERPEDGKAAYCLGNTLRRVGRFEEAQQAYAQAAKSMPQAYQALVNRGNTLMNDLGRREEGIESLRAAVVDIETPRTGATARRQISGAPYLALGAALRKTGDAAGAKAAFRGGLKHADSRGAAEAELKALGETP